MSTITPLVPWSPLYPTNTDIIEENFDNLNNGKAEDNAVVKLTWNQTIDWVKQFEKELALKHLTTPTNPASWYNKLYFKDDWKLYYLNSAWVETKVWGWWGWWGWTQMYEWNIDWQTFNGMIARFTVRAGQTLSGVKITSASLPVWSNFTLDVRRNWIATTNSIFTSDTGVSITTAQWLTNWVYTTTKTAIDNGVCVADDVLYVFVVDAWSTLPLSDLYFLIY